MPTSTTKCFIMLSSIVLHSSKVRMSTSFSMFPTTVTTRQQLLGLSARTRTTLKATISTETGTGSNFISVADAISKFESTTFIDGSWHLSKDRNGRDEYEQGPRIKGSHFFDIDDVATKNHPKNLPHMMPSKKMFASAMDSFSIQSSSPIVIYGTKDCAFAARAYYTFKTLCHPSNDVYLMQGSLQEWIDAGGPVETEVKTSFRVSDDFNDDNAATTYDALEDHNSVTMDEMLKEVSDTSNSSIIIDARGAARFNAEAPEPRPGLRGGHMPGAYNVPFTTLLQDDDVTKFKSTDEMKGVFKDAGLADIETTEKKVILSCGSGVTACVLAVALSECGKDSKDIFIYDGSWLEWGSDPDTPIV